MHLSMHDIYSFCAAFYSEVLSSAHLMPTQSSLMSFCSPSPRYPQCSQLTVSHNQGQVRHTVILLRCVCAYVLGRGGLKINAVQGHAGLCAPSDTWELHFTPCAFSIVRQRGSIDGQQGDDKMGNPWKDEKGSDSWQRDGESGLMSEVGRKLGGQTQMLQLRVRKIHN